MGLCVEIYLGSRPNTDMIASSTESRTPVSNTGLIPRDWFKSSVDTLTFVLRGVTSGHAAMDIKALIEREFNDCIDFDTHRPTFMMRPWDGSSRSSVRGIQLHWKAPNDEEPGHLRVHLPGKAIAATTQESFRDCIQVLWELFKGDCTRIDVAVDDGLKLTDMNALNLAQEKRNYTGVRSHRRVSSGGLKERDGVTYYFGSAASDLQLRVYDKTVESKGAVDAIRWELQLRRAKATEMCNLWLDVQKDQGSTVAACLSGAVAGAVDFIDRSAKGKDLSRCDRLPWWEKIRSYLSAAYKLKPKQKEVLMDKKIGWLCHAVMPSLALVKRYMGDALFWRFVDEEIQEKEPLLSLGSMRLIERARENDKGRLKMCEAARKIREYFEPKQTRLDLKVVYS